MELRTVGDLRKLVAQLDAEGVSDAFPLARRGQLGGEWANGFGQAGEIELVSYGSAADKITFSTAADPFKGKGRGRKIFKALAID